MSSGARRTELVTVRTRFRHWAQRSGYSLLPEYLQAGGRTRVREIVTNKIPRIEHGDWARSWRPPPIPWYAPEDQLSECELRRQLSEAPADVAHFLDGENGMGLHSGVLALDSWAWQVLRFTLWQGRVGATVHAENARRYEVLHLSAPGSAPPTVLQAAAAVG